MVWRSVCTFLDGQDLVSQLHELNSNWYFWYIFFLLEVYVWICACHYISSRWRSPAHIGASAKSEMHSSLPRIMHASFAVVLIVPNGLFLWTILEFHKCFLNYPYSHSLWRRLFLPVLKCSWYGNSRWPSWHTWRSGRFWCLKLHRFCTRHLPIQRTRTIPGCCCQA